MTEKEIMQRRTAAYKHGKTAKTVTPLDVASFRLGHHNPDAATLLAAYMKAQKDGDSSSLDVSNAVSLTAAELLRREAIDVLSKEGLMVEEPLRNAHGEVVGTRRKPHPLLEMVKWLMPTLGQDAASAGLTRGAKPRGAQAAEINAALARDQRLREANRAGRADRLPPPDPELLKMGTPEELERWKAECQDRYENDPVYRARRDAAEALRLDWENKQREESALEKEPS